MKNNNIPKITEQELSIGLKSAINSPRHRHPKIMHEKGDEFNHVFNFFTSSSYMQPHLHPGDEKIEEIYIVQGKVAVIFFDNKGKIQEINLLEKGGTELVVVPAFTWHTYVLLTENAVTYETMMGVYDPQTWKSFAEWAPLENSDESTSYLEFLKTESAKKYL